ncbi:DUF3558 domain-containing protein [Nocardia sp. NPDC127579]|uniref:DUF3558 domain-containing protein n=1 Tax=Nocardia sp. NPDC127579 TaxID=3345402 RepID=UPI003634306F
MLGKLTQKVGVSMRAIAGSLLMVGVVGVGSLLAGCQSETKGGGTSTPAEPSIAENVPTGIDPCNLPADVLKSIHPKLKKGTTDDNSARGKIKWQGCRYVISNGNGYSAHVSLTNLTLDMVREKNFPGERETTINGRTVLTTHQEADPTGDENCVLYAQMNGGSLEFGVSNSNSAPETGALSACDIGMSMAEKIVPLIAAGS